MNGNAKKTFLILIALSAFGYFLINSLEISVTYYEEGKKCEIPLEKWQKKVIEINQELTQTNEQLQTTNKQLTQQLEAIKQTIK